MSPAITGGDVDVDVENAYFTGDEAPGGDNPTPDQEVVDDIGKALGVEYQDNEELKASDKVTERDTPPLGARSGVVGGLQGKEKVIGCSIKRLARRARVSENLCRPRAAARCRRSRYAPPCRRRFA